jgi:hypothetical protein
LQALCAAGQGKKFTMPAANFSMGLTPSKSILQFRFTSPTLYSYLYFEILVPLLMPTGGFSPALHCVQQVRANFLHHLHSAFVSKRQELKGDPRSS